MPKQIYRGEMYYADLSHVIGSEQGRVIEKSINGCSVILSFLRKPSPDVMENIQSILSNAYGERLQKDLQAIQDG